MVNEDLMSALQELLEASSVLVGEQPPSESELERYKRAREWACRLIDRERNS